MNMLKEILNLPDVDNCEQLQGKKLGRFKSKVKKAEQVFNNGGVYTCPVCDGKSRMCDDDYQSLECEYLERDMLGDSYYAN